MPFTLAHPAAVIPLRRLLSRWTVPSALVIGSITPDLAYILPIGVARDASHSVAALFWFSVPVGASVYLLFHLVLKQPLLSLASMSFARRLSVIAPPGSPAASWPTVLVSLLFGAITHLAWDAFTHEGGTAVRVFEPLRAELFWIGSFQVFVYKALQHGSTLFGLCVLTWWTVAWHRDAAIEPEPPVTLTHSQRLFSISLLVAIPGLVGLGVALWGSSGGVPGTGLPIIVRQAVLFFLSMLVSSLLVFSMWWNLRWGSRRA